MLCTRRSDPLGAYNDALKREIDADRGRHPACRIGDPVRTSPVSHVRPASNAVTNEASPSHGRSKASKKFWRVATTFSADRLRSRQQGAGSGVSICSITSAYGDSGTIATWSSRSTWATWSNSPIACRAPSNGRSTSFTAAGAGAKADDAYFAPLKCLALRPDTELCLGLVHYTDGVEGTKKRLAMARKYAEKFSIATECGFGRRDPNTIPKLLRIHAEVSGGFNSKGPVPMDRHPASYPESEASCRRITGGCRRLLSPFAARRCFAATSG